MGTFSQKASSIKRKWYLVDAQDKTLGRLATIIAKCLNGKNNPEYTPNLDTGDYVVVINAEKIRTTGNKLKDKKYYHHTGYQGGIKEFSLEKLLIKAPRRVLEAAVKGMLPKGPLGREMLKKLKIYIGTEHPHQAQKLTPLTV
ncbi:50S ribosomal subunit protein L13 [Gammaproteobacteria bacterium]